jgi:hypothetical protein
MRRPAPDTFWLALAFCIAMAFVHLISLPIVVTYDGLGYIDMADVLGSARFPRDWLENRTPLYPALLKISFWLFGRQPLAAMFVGTSMAAAGIVILGFAIRRIAGSTAAAALMVLLSLFPTLIAYEHCILTEAGTFFFFAVLVAAALWIPLSRSALNWKTGALALALTVGFYWRQNLLALAPVLALVIVVDALRLHWPAGWRERSLLLARAACVIALPYLLSKPWDRYSDPALVTDITLKQGIVRQALLPPDDPVAAPCRAEYESAIADSMSGGNFYSGVAWRRLNAVSPKCFGQFSLRETPRLFLSLVRKYPGRYLAGFGRTVLFFSGFPGSESDNRSYRDLVFSRTLNGSKISDGPEPLHTRISEQFRQNSTQSVVLRLLRALFMPYDLLVIASVFIGAGVLIWSLAVRDCPSFILSALPLWYLLCYAVFLVSIDRFMVPVYPVLISGSVVAVFRLLRRYRANRG